MSEQGRLIGPDGEDITPESFTVRLANKVDPVWSGGTFARNFVTANFESTVEVDRATYDSIDGGLLYTVEIEHDLNPWHRTTTTFRQRLRKLRDGLLWTFRREVLRRELVETARITIPDCSVGDQGEQR